MPTDDERREVARRLRGLDDSELQVYDMTYFAIQRAVGGGGDQYPDGRELADRLADLIEPQTSEQTNPQESSLSASLCDRDALLRLAAEINDTSCDNHGELSVSLGDIWGWAQVIREVLGVSE